MKKRHPGTLSTGENNTVIALSDMEVGKIFTGDTRSDIGSEAENKNSWKITPAIPINRQVRSIEIYIAFKAGSHRGA